MSTFLKMKNLSFKNVPSRTLSTKDYQEDEEPSLKPDLQQVRGVSSEFHIISWVELSTAVLDTDDTEAFPHHYVTLPHFVIAVKIGLRMLMLRHPRLFSFVVPTNHRPQ